MQFLTSSRQESRFMTMKMAVVYARVSTKDQKREGYSIPAQLRILREYALKNKLTIVKEFLETESAGKAGRTAFGSMVDLIESKKSIQAILVEKTDRLYRNFKDQVLLDDLGVDIHFVKDNRIIGKDSKPSDIFVNEIETAQARFYLNNLSQEVRKGLDQKVREGKYPCGPVPIGYVRNPFSKGIEIDPDRAAIIRRLFDLYSTGEYSLDSLCSEAKRMGLTYRRSGKPIVRAEIDRMLKKVFYTGRFNWKGQVYQGDHPAIVESDLFDHAQLVSRRKQNGRGAVRWFTFSRLMLCGDCNHTVTAEIKRGRNIYYHCTGYSKTHKLTYVPERVIDQQMAQIVGAVTLPEDFYEFLKVALEAEFSSQKVRTARDRERLETEREKIRTRMRKAYQDKLDGSVSAVFFQSVYDDYQNQLSAVEYRLVNLPQQSQANFDMAQKAIELSYQAESLYLRASPQQKRRLLKSVLSNCILKGPTLYPIYKKPFDILAEGIESGNKRG